MEKKAPSSPADRLPVPVETIARRIYVIRGQKVMLSPDLAELYQVEPRALVQAVKRNLNRFPPDFMFQLTSEEYADLKSQIVISSWGGARRATPYAFTEHGVAMLSSVLRSDRAVQMNILIIRAFVKMRELLASHKELATKVEQVEAVQRHQARTQQQHTIILESVVKDIQRIKNPPQTRVMGFIYNPKRKKKN